MARSDQIRAEIARLESKRANLARDIAKHEKAAVSAREAARSEYGAKRYHQAADEWSPDWDYRGMIEDLTVFYDVGRDLANGRDWPQWKPGSEFGPVREATAAERR